MDTKHWNQLEEIMQKMKALGHAINILYWDMETEAPELAIDNIADTIGILSKESHQLLVSETTLGLIEDLEKNNESLSEIQNGIIKELRKNYDQISKIPVDEFAEYTKLATKSQNVWVKAKNDNDFEMFAPYLKKLIDYNKKFINYRGYKDHPYNTLLDDFEPGFTVEKADAFFEGLKKRIVPLLKKVQNSNVQVDTSFLEAECPIENQKELAKYLSDYIKFDMRKGIIKESEHPFTTNFCNNDVRITTHYYLNNPMSSIFSTLHEGGHGIYEQGVSDEITATVLGEGVSMGIHESQSRLYENIFGRSLEFWAPIYDDVKKYVPALENVNIDDFYKAINKAEASLIRVEADELTYSLHVMVRYEIEKMIFGSDIDVNDLPKIWNDKMEEYLGIRPETDAKGILQDVHWSGGSFGYFASYAIGSSNASQIDHQLRKDFDFDDLMKNGKFEEIKEYLGKHIHQFGKRKTPSEILVDMTGEDINPDYYCDYLENKFSKIYKL